MSLITDLQPYTDGNGLVSPTLLPNPPPQRASDNGVLFASQALILNTVPYAPLVTTILGCITPDGYLHRAPGDTTQDQPDDHYGIFAAANALGITIPPITLPWSICQPGLLYCRGMARGNPLVRLFSPLMACILALSNVGEDVGNTSNKLLTFTTIFGLYKKSFLCRLGGMVWLYRMRRLYPAGTLSIAQTYFGATHPFCKYWRDPC